MTGSEGCTRVDRQPISCSRVDLPMIASLRDQFRAKMDCQIVHDSIHDRNGWTQEFAFRRLHDGSPIGYASVAVGGPWRHAHSVYEYFIQPAYGTRSFELFSMLLTECDPRAIEVQTNDSVLTVMLHAFTKKVRTEKILFEDLIQTSYRPAGVELRAATGTDADKLRALDLDEHAGWVVTENGEIVGEGGVLYHYNPPYGDVYMNIAAPFRRKGLGLYLVQELKAMCRAAGKVPAARCDVDNHPSRLTLESAGFVPCGALVVGELVRPAAAVP